MAGYLDEIQRQNLEYIEAVGAARTTREKAAVVAKLLPAKRAEARKAGQLERIQIENRAIKERQAAQEAGQPMPAQDEMTMAPPELQVTGSKGSGQGLGLLEEVFGGGGASVQPAAKGAGSMTVEPAQPGYRNVTETSTTTGPSRVNDPRAMIMARLFNPKALGPQTSTSTSTRTERDPQVFSANVAGLAGQMWMDQTSGNSKGTQASYSQLANIYGEPYAKSVLAAARATTIADKAARERAIPALSRELATTYDLDPATANAAAQAEARDDYDTYAKIIGEKKPLSVRSELAKIKASNATADAQRELAGLRKEQAITERANREQAKASINTMSLDQMLLPYSTAGFFTSKYAGESGQVSPKDVFRAIGDILDEEGNYKPSEAFTARSVQDYLVKFGGLLVFPSEPGLLGGMFASWTGKENRAAIMGLGETADLIRRKDTETLSRLGLMRERDEEWVYTYVVDPLDPNANPSRALENWMLLGQSLGEEFQPQADRGINQVVQQGTAQATSAPAPVEGPMQGPSLPPVDFRAELKARSEADKAALVKMLKAPLEAIGRRQRVLEERFSRIGEAGGD